MPPLESFRSLTDATTHLWLILKLSYAHHIARVLHRFRLQRSKATSAGSQGPSFVSVSISSSTHNRDHFVTHRTQPLILADFEELIPSHTGRLLIWRQLSERLALLKDLIVCGLTELRSDGKVHGPLWLIIPSNIGISIVLSLQNSDTLLRQNWLFQRHIVGLLYTFPSCRSPFGVEDFTGLVCVVCHWGCSFTHSRIIAIALFPLLASSFTFFLFRI